jgi:hypothetical protein
MKIQDEITIARSIHLVCTAQVWRTAWLWIALQPPVNAYQMRPGMNADGSLLTD